MSGDGAATVLQQLDEDGVLLLTLNRPDRHNAWNLVLEQALHDRLAWASEAEAVRAVVLTGAGRSFCPGLDSQELDRVSQGGQGYQQEGRRPIVLPALVAKPVICAINGACAGLGLVTALASDVRFAADEARITTSFARRGLPAEEAVSWILPRIVGHATALDLLLSSRVVTGREAAELGLVHRSLPAAELLGAAMDYAREVATTCSPIAVAAAKAQVYRDWSQSLAASRADARRQIAELRRSSSDFREGVRSFVEKRSPDFAPFGATADLAGFETGRPRPVPD
jgi:enoyl-CoA hydratase/carnithine racemase